MDTFPFLHSCWEWLREPNGTSLANLTSIVGFGFTLYVLITVRQIKRGYFVKARMPALIGRLTEHGAILSECLGAKLEPAKFVAVRVEIEKTKRTLKDLTDKVERERKKTIDKVLRTIEKIPPGTSIPEDDLRQLYIDILACLDDVKEYQEDLKWKNA